MPEGGGWESKEEWKEHHYRRRGSAGNPDRYDTCRRKPLKGAAGVSLIYCHVRGAGPNEWDTQAVRFSKANFTLEQAKAWMRGHPNVFSEPAVFSEDDKEVVLPEWFGAEGEGSTRTIEKTDVLVTGSHTDRSGNTLKVDVPYLDGLVANFKKLAGVLKPPVKLGHDRQSILKRSGLPAAGWITDLWREGETLFAKLEDIPEKVYQLIQRKRYRRKSSEVRGNFTHDGVNYGPVFWGLALIGGDIPAIKTLDDILALTDEDDSPSIFFTVDAKEGGEDMPKEFTQDDLDKARTDAVKAKEAELIAQFAEKEKDLQKKADDAAKELDDLKVAKRTEKIEAFTERLANARVATVFTKESGLATFLEGLNDGDVVQFTEGDDGKATAMDFAMAFTEKLVQAAADDKLFVPEGEVGPGDEGGVKELVDGEPVTTDEAETAKRMVESQKTEEVKL